MFRPSHARVSKLLLIFVPSFEHMRRSKKNTSVSSRRYRTKPGGHAIDSLASVHDYANPLSMSLTRKNGLNNSVS